MQKRKEITRTSMRVRVYQNGCREGSEKRQGWIVVDYVKKLGDSAAC